MTLHPDAKELLDKLRHAPEADEVPLEEFRKAALLLISGGPKQKIGRVDDITIEGPDGLPLKLRIYTPQGGGPFPIIVWIHGGSFVRATLDVFDAERRDFVHRSNCIIVAVDQRLAPETKFPGPLHDAYAALEWASNHAMELNGIPDRIGIAGESSGGNLAAATTLLTRERGGPKISFQLLVSPLLDAHCTAPSVDKFGTGYLFTKRQLLWMYKQYAPDVSPDNPLLSPGRATDLRFLPPAIIITIEYDPVRDEAEEYAELLKAAGVPVFHFRLEGMLHYLTPPEPTPTGVRLLQDLFRSQPQ